MKKACSKWIHQSGGKQLEKAHVEECGYKDQRKDVAVQKSIQNQGRIWIFFLLNTRQALLCLYADENEEETARETGNGNIYTHTHIKMINEYK